MKRYKRMKIYIATPVNARKEATLEEKRKAAHERVLELAEMLKQKFPSAEFHSSFDWDIAPLGCHCVKDEPQIMGKCVRRVMECDMVFLDEGWKESKGCVVEFYTADTYEKEVKCLKDMKL